MNAKKNTTILMLLALVSAALPALASEEIELQYRRERKQQAPAAASAPRTGLPDALRLEAPEAPSPEARPEAKTDAKTESKPGAKGETSPENRRKAGTIRDHNPPPAEPGRDWSGLERQAWDAAAWAARELARSEGRRNYYRAGFYHGLHAAFDAPGLGRRDEREGLEDGRRDPEAQRRGYELGSSAADADAEAAAARAVAAQFHDLSREPRPEAVAGRWDFEPRLPPVREPALERVMGDYPLARFAANRDFGSAPDPWHFYNCRSYGEVYDGRWQKPKTGFELWRDHDRRRGLWRSLSEPERAFFERAFVRAYPHWLGRERPGLERAWDDGWDDGWRYGAFAVAEWSYRRGYREGYSRALSDAAAAAFDRGYPRAYEAHYDRHFDDWATSARPELRGARLEDENDDGVFEPGEEVLVSWEMVNYGGRPLDADLRLEGSVLDRPAAARVLVPRRSRERAPRPLVAAIARDARPRTEARLVLSVADAREELPLRVGYPLELEREVRVRAQETAAGRAALELGVRNQSRRSAAGWAELRLPEGRSGARQLDLGRVAAGERRTVSFEVGGLDPLALVAGESEVQIVVREDATVFDELRYRFPDRVGDLGRRDLLEVMVELARGPRPEPATVGRAHRLMVRRLEVDWQAVASGRGNAYQEDLERGTRTSALGDLVATWREQRRSLRHPEVFADLAPRVRELSESLPGTHPFLRRSMKRLARELEQ